jgi:pantetheine-phosphate adenylyltransferase
MARKAIYAGSFDPVTLGHVDVITRGAGLFDELIVAVGNNPAKNYMFDLDARQSMLARSCTHLTNVRVMAFSGLLVDTAKAEGAALILRGLRALSDFDLEFRNGLANRDMSGIETVFLISDPNYIFVSSSLVKEIALNGGNVERYVPDFVVDALAASQSR